ncbi:MAG: hypothetical protein GWO02_08870, partial [Gammaproteobacteria bacterium]|nr:hypothetical protein [Gammaproteobacteria bacterium]
MIELEAGVAVIGTDTWAALCGREALEVTWDEGANAALSTETVHQRLAGAAERRGRVELNRGRV